MQVLTGRASTTEWGWRTEQGKAVNFSRLAIMHPELHRHSPQFKSAADSGAAGGAVPHLGTLLLGHADEGPPLVLQSRPALVSWRPEAVTVWIGGLGRIGGGLGSRAEGGVGSKPKTPLVGCT